MTFQTTQTADEISIKMTDFLCNVLTTVVLDGVVSVTDLAGNIACKDNNYLLSEDGTEFAGLATVADGEVTEFRIFENPKTGAWSAELPCRLVA
jgi:hypothetical protein